MKQSQIGEQVTKLRKQKGFSQKELAIQCKITVRSIQRIEGGNVKPRLSTLKALSSELDFDFLKNDLGIKDQSSSVRDKHFLKQFIQKTSEHNLPSSFYLFYSSILSLVGLVFLITTILHTVNNLNNEKIILFIFLPGLLGSLLIFFLAGWIFTNNKKQNDRKKLAAFITKHVLHDRNYFKSLVSKK